MVWVFRGGAGRAKALGLNYYNGEKNRVGEEHPARDTRERKS